MKVPIAEQLVEPGGDLHGLVGFQVGIAAAQNGPAELARHAAAEADQPFAVRGQHLLVDPRLAIEAFEEGGRRQLDQVLEADAVLGQQRQMVTGLFVLADFAFVPPIARRDVGFVADDRVDAGRLGLLIELQRAVQIAVVGQGQGVHAQRLGLLDQRPDRAGAVQQAVMAMAVQMDERAVVMAFLWAAALVPGSRDRRRLDLYRLPHATLASNRLPRGACAECGLIALCAGNSGYSSSGGSPTARRYSARRPCKSSTACHWRSSSEIRPC